MGTTMMKPVTPDVVQQRARDGRCLACGRLLPPNVKVMCVEHAFRGALAKAMAGELPERERGS